MLWITLNFETNCCGHRSLVKVGEASLTDSNVTINNHTKSPAGRAIATVVEMLDDCCVVSGNNRCHLLINDRFLAGRDLSASTDIVVIV